MPAARQQIHFFRFLSKHATLTKIVPDKKNATFKKSIHGTAVWEKRQMGNVLLIVIFVIRICLAELSQSKVHFTGKKQPGAGRAGQHVLK